MLKIVVDMDSSGQSYKQFMLVNCDLECRCRDLQRSGNEMSHYLDTGLSEDKTPSESIVSGRNNPVSLGALW